MTTSAETFRSLHQGPDVLFLPNAWDAVSAKLLERAGARAVGTTSAAVAWSHGYPDGNSLPIECLLATVRAISRVVRIPLSVDCEAGYSADPSLVADTVDRVLDAGAAGLNLEDGTSPSELLAEKITHVKRAAARRGVDVFVNARIDVYLKALVAESERLSETLTRARRYRDAGADGIFVPKLLDANELREVVAGAGLPVNVLAWPGLPASAALRELGVRRLSAGSAFAQHALGHVDSLARSFCEHGAEFPREGALSNPELNALF
jgi:2-methylisocitrate lyase-like PEP mutase family enzyme